MPLIDEEILSTLCLVIDEDSVSMVTDRVGENKYVLYNPQGSEYVTATVKLEEMDDWESLLEAVGDGSVSAESLALVKEAFEHCLITYYH